MALCYGWKRGLPSRLFVKAALPSMPSLSVKNSLIDTGFLPPIWDQGKTESCTGHGVARVIAFVRAKQGLPFIDFSRLFPYWNARAAEGSTASDSGAVIADVIVAAQKFGDCAYSDLPTDPALITVAPSAAIFASAVQHKALDATRILGRTADSMQYHFKHCIDKLGMPVVLGITVYESFESDQVANTGIVPMPALGEEVVGGHCIVGVGYDDTTQLVLAQNSWGEAWGMNGTFTIPYSYIFDPDLAADFHAVTLEAA